MAENAALNIVFQKEIISVIIFPKDASINTSMIGTLLEVKAI